MSTPAAPLGVAPPTDENDVERFLQEVEADAVYKEVLARLTEMEMEFPGQSITHWSVLKNQQKGRWI